MPDAAERLMRRVDKCEDGCWVRTGAAVRGYPVVKIAGKQHRAARLAYELWVGPIPAGLTIDHLCRNTRCVNPDHLEAVTNAENARRAAEANKPSHCPQGHAYADHAYLHGGRTYCRACRHGRQMRWRGENADRWKEIKSASARRVYHRAKETA